ncbi:cytochrome b [Streptomyces sp. NPDC059152]|uniref:cytochrome b n=1 Tax=Streptomyces sp. NPDC059152 TaxID=3346742 RepID=UPI0036924014
MTTESADPETRYTITARVLHWTMALLVLAMLFIGVFMVTSVSDFHLLVTLHEPLGFAILALVLVRIGWRLTHTPPPLPTGIPRLERLAAMYSERLIYLLLLLQPLFGWALVSASGQPVVLFGSWNLPAIAPMNITLFAVLLRAHEVTAYVLYALFLAHLAGILWNTLVIRNRILHRMTFRPRLKPAARDCTVNGVTPDQGRTPDERRDRLR